MTVIHLVYPHGQAISCPEAIGRNTGFFLAKHGYKIRHYNWNERITIFPEAGDILLGHPSFDPNTTFRLSMHRPGWKKIIAMFPFQPGDLRQSAWTDQVIPHCDLFLAITGRYWFDVISSSPFSHFLPRTIHLDLAVDRKDFPAVKKKFNLPGKRRFLYIGHTSWYKNTSFLRSIAKSFPSDNKIGWIGSGMPMPELVAHGQQDFSTELARDLVSNYDFMITVGSADANPTTILEAMSWGLIPVCTPQSGYQLQYGIENVPLNNTDMAMKCINKLQHASAEHLMHLQELNWHALDEHFNWDRFGNIVLKAILSQSAPPVLQPSIQTTLRLRWAERTAPWSPSFPMPALRWAARLMRNKGIGK